MWKLFIDTGGTFTDCLALSPDRKEFTIKVLSDGSLRGRISKIENGRIYLENFPFPKNPYLEGYHFHTDRTGDHNLLITNWIPGSLSFEQPEAIILEEGDILRISGDESAPVLAARMICRVGLDEDLPVEELRLATTLGTNALLEKKGAKVCLITTRGFKDVLKIGDQSRPELFNLIIPDRDTFCNTVIEVDERIDSHGNIITNISDSISDQLHRTLDSANFNAVAISTVNSYKNPRHESILENNILKRGVKHVSVSHKVSGDINFLDRTSTTVANAYLAPIMEAYKERIKEKFPHARIFYMRSEGALSPADFFAPKDSLLSGPAAGVMGAFSIAKKFELSKAVAFDMGGTSTDTSFISGKPAYADRFVLNNARLQIPVMDIDTVAAGGGSICQWTNSGFQCGPESASAFPGPACYGQGGPLTLTDLALLTGRLDPDMVNIPLLPTASYTALDKVYQNLPLDQKPDHTELAELFIQLAVEQMASSISRISTSKGHALNDACLISFGGAGGMYACQLADHLGIEMVLAPHKSGVLSAEGLKIADLGITISKPVFKDLSDRGHWLKNSIEKVKSLAIEEASRQGWKPSKEIDVSLQCRVKGQASKLDLVYGPENKVDLNEAFIKAYRRMYGYDPPSGEFECVGISIRLKERPESIDRVEHPVKSEEGQMKSFKAPLTGMQVFTHHWNGIKPGSTVNGPALIAHKEASVFVPNGWVMSVSPERDLIIHKLSSAVTFPKALENKSKWSTASLYANRFTQIAMEMGTMLKHASVSTNVKERLDFSCAIMDNKGRLLVNAPHIPVHLGSMGISVRMVLEDFPIKPGDIIIYNHPQYGGSHLPDISLIKGVFDEEDNCIAYLANRAHHAEIGGISPGSMPVNATKLEEEGVIIRPFYLSVGGEFQWDEMEKIFNQAKYPSRSPRLNISDIRSAVASLNKGERRLLELLDTVGLNEIFAATTSIYEMSVNSIRRKIVQLTAKKMESVEHLDNGTPIKVLCEKSGDRLRFSFEGTGPVQPGNMNANISIVYSVILYVLRLWINEEIPLNDGIMEQIDIELPDGMLNPDFSDDRFAPATAAGNVELSQRLCDTLIKALGLAACSQGTMNNVLFGNEYFGYYETIGGGAGATLLSDGGSGVHTHMTNTRITDVEEMERRFPVRIEEFAIRENSGGNGKRKGGDGLRRVYYFLKACTLSFIGQHRVERPFGMNGGAPGKTGRQWVEKADGSIIELEGIDSFEIEEGDKFILETPGGGGWGVEN